MRNIRQKLSIARGEQPAELLFKNARLVNVLSGEIYSANVAVDDGRIVGIGGYSGRKTIDLRGAYLAPSLIDGHFHVESSMLTAPEFARAVVPHGTGAVVIDPHEYANVLGLEGDQWLDDWEYTQFFVGNQFVPPPRIIRLRDGWISGEEKVTDRIGAEAAAR